MNDREVSGRARRPSNDPHILHSFYDHRRPHREPVRFSTSRTGSYTIATLTAEPLQSKLDAQVESVRRARRSRNVAVSLPIEQQHRDRDRRLRHRRPLGHDRDRPALHHRRRRDRPAPSSRRSRSPASATPAPPAARSSSHRLGRPQGLLRPGPDLRPDQPRGRRPGNLDDARDALPDDLGAAGDHAERSRSTARPTRSRAGPSPGTGPTPPARARRTSSTSHRRLRVRRPSPWPTGNVDRDGCPGELGRLHPPVANGGPDLAKPNGLTSSSLTATTGTPAVPPTADHVPTIRNMISVHGQISEDLSGRRQISTRWRGPLEGSPSTRTSTTTTCSTSGEPRTMTDLGGYYDLRFPLPAPAPTPTPATASPYTIRLVDERRRRPRTSALRPTCPKQRHVPDRGANHVRLLPARGRTL